MIVIDSRTGFPVGDPDILPFPQDYTGGGFASASRGLILSASGWRKVFAADGDEESTSPEIAAADRELAAYMALAFGRFLLESSAVERPRLVVGIDARHTGPTIADVMIRVFLGLAIDVEYLFIAAAPEIMAYARTSGAQGFAYVSASHNPIGHNGVKFGLQGGGVLGGRDAARLIESLKAIGADDASFATVRDLVQTGSGKPLARVYEGIDNAKTRALEAYTGFTRTVVTGTDDPEAWNELVAAAKARPAGVVAELNGSARGVSIDQEFLAGAEVKVWAVNAAPREIKHRIVPEGESLDLCREILAEKSAEDPAYVLGYVPDNDGDRGNIVYRDSRTATVRILEAQEVFALAVLAELAYLVYSGKMTYGADGRNTGKVAVAVNGPTSLRIDAIAKAFDVKVFRAEVGEANAVTLASDLRSSGYLVRILGEGSNGGNITHPSAVRDPIATIFAFLKLLWLRGNDEKSGLFRIWCDRTGIAYDENFDLSTVVASLPPYTTTSAYEPQAKMEIRSERHGALKAAYEELFRERWESIAPRLKDELGVRTWKEINYEGPEEKHGFGPTYRSGKERGGLKILFKDDAGTAKAYLWMRGSGTEPVFRVLADVEGTRPELETWLLNWHRELIKEADAKVLG